MEYSEALNYIHSLMKFGSRPGLERITELLHKIGDPQDKLDIIHVAGTNGKGSTCVFLSSILRASGRKTGLYISPFVCGFNERMQINGEPISDSALTKLVERVKYAAESLPNDGCKITEFEFITAAALLWFYESRCDTVVLEVGLGGRLDATNVIKKPLCSVIARIALDHTAVLGNTEAEIAFEKCGIIKQGCPTVTTADNSGKALQVIEEIASKRSSKLVVTDVNSAEVKKSDVFGSEFIYREQCYHILLPGRHQISNALIAIEAAMAAYGDISEKDTVNGLSAARFPARCEVISAEPLVILDGSHNPNGTGALSELLSSLELGRTVAVVGFMADKDVSLALEKLCGRFEKIITVRVESNSRTMEASALAELCRKICDDVKTAEDYASALEMTSGFDSVVVFGSLYLAGDIRPLLIDRFATKNN